jgi:hypothetical protein
MQKEGSWSTFQVGRNLLFPQIPTWCSGGLTRSWEAFNARTPKRAPEEELQGRQEAKKRA